MRRGSSLIVLRRHEHVCRETGFRARSRRCSEIPSSVRRARNQVAMHVSAKATSFEDIILWRDMYRSEMGCQITHDSIHTRPGWTQEYLLFLRGTAVGYGSVAVAGPWAEKPTVYEFYVVPHQPRLHAFELFDALLAASR